MNNMERIGWWFLRHSKPQRTYFFICPNCNTLNPSIVKKCGKCGLKVIYKTDVALSEIWEEGKKELKESILF